MGPNLYTASPETDPMTALLLSQRAVMFMTQVLNHYIRTHPEIQEATAGAT